MALDKCLWTIGHSVHSIERFTELLQYYDIAMLVDVRSKPGSKIHIQFNQAAFSKALAGVGIEYIHLPELGGKHTGALSYTEYMRTDAFKKGIVRLEALANRQRVAYMCAEALWWQCHRAKISDHLFINGWHVVHIMGRGRSMIHKRLVGELGQGKLF